MAKCSHCGIKGAHNLWTLNACADNRRTRKPRLCDPCDVTLNRIVLEFFQVSHVDEKMDKYCSKLEHA